MKKRFVFLALGFLFAINLSQVKAQSFNAGLVVGPTFCQVDGDKYFGFHKLGFTAGAYANLPVADHFALQMEFLPFFLVSLLQLKELFLLYFLLLFVQ